jgi:pimeloyl-ACP methyl ester carboxylesterase
MKLANTCCFYVIILLVSSLVGCTTKTTETSENQDRQFESHLINLNGINLHYQIAGKGAPLLFLHGGFGTGKLQFQPQFEALKNDYQLISPDTRGHGQSTFDSVPFSYELFAKDVYLLVEELKLDSVNIIGFSDGGITGLILAATHPEKVRNLVVIGGNIKPDTSAFPQEAIDWVRDMNVTEMEKNLEASFPHYPTPEKLPEFVERMQKLWLEEPNLTDKQLQAIQCPTLIIAGENDDIKVSHQEYIHQQIPNSKLHIIADAGHEAHMEKKKVVNALIRGFME